MAQSSSFSKPFGPSSRYNLLVKWTATQDISANKSTVVAKLYLNTDEYASMRYSATKYGSITINGNTKNLTVTDDMNAGAHDEVYLGEHEVVVTHDADGEKTITISASFDFDVTLSGQKINNITASDSIKLTTIPRASSLSSGASWTAGGNIKLSISRASSSFSHEAEISVLEDDGVTYNWVKQITFSTSQTTRDVTPDDSEQIEIFTILKQKASAKTRVVLQTFKGSDMIGEKTYYGTVTAPAASTLSLPSTFDVGGVISDGITRKDSEFDHNIRLQDGETSLVVMATGAGTSFSYNTSAIATTLYNLMKTVQTKVLKVRIFTMYKGVQVRGPVDYNITAKVVNSNPTFSAFTFKDTNAVTVGFTGSDQKIVQNQSDLSVTIPLANKAMPKNSATMIEYAVTVNGITKKKAYSSTADVVIPFGKVNAAANFSILVEAIDSRGFKTPVSKNNIEAIPYKAPVAVLTAPRVNTFEDLTDIKVSGTYSPMTVNSAPTNAIQSIDYSVSGLDFSENGAMTITQGSGKFSSLKRVTLDNLKAFDVSVTIKDKISTVTLEVVVPVGRPIFYIDSKLRSLGFNDFPNTPDTFLFNGKLTFGSNMYADKGGGIDMNNGDIVGANGIYLKDKADNNGEGVLFPRDNTPVGSTNQNDYDTLRVLNGVLYINNSPIALEKSTAIWTGAKYPDAGDEVIPSIPLSKCPNGWILAWSDYNYGAGAQDIQWAFTTIHKDMVREYPGKDHLFMVPNYSNGTKDTYITKVCTVFDTKIVGNAENVLRTGGGWGGTEDKTDLVVRRVYAF